jgi:hypothetical protein
MQTLSLTSIQIACDQKLILTMMNTMKKSLLAALFLGAIALTGCKDPCETADCINGVCSEDPNDRNAAICTCSPGYETENCSKGINAKLSGTYNLDETCTVNTQARTYDVVLSAKAGTTKEFTIGGLYSYGQQYTVTAVMGENGSSFTIAKQELGTTTFQVAATNGTLSSDGKQLTLTYAVTFRDTIPVEECTATLTR